MGRKSPYPEEFRKDAVALYRASGGKQTYAAVAADLGITGETLRTWVRKEAGGSAPEPPGGTALSPTEELARLRAGNQRLLACGPIWSSMRSRQLSPPVADLSMAWYSARIAARNIRRMPSPPHVADTEFAALWAELAPAMTVSLLAPDPARIRWPRP